MLVKPLPELIGSGVRPHSRFGPDELESLERQPFAAWFPSSLGTPRRAIEPAPPRARTVTGWRTLAEDGDE